MARPGAYRAVTGGDGVAGRPAICKRQRPGNVPQLFGVVGSSIEPRDLRGRPISVGVRGKDNMATYAMLMRFTGQGKNTAPQAGDFKQMAIRHGTDREGNILESRPV